MQPIVHRQWETMKGNLWCSEFLSEQPNLSWGETQTPSTAILSQIPSGNTKAPKLRCELWEVDIKASVSRVLAVQAGGDPTKCQSLYSALSNRQPLPPNKETKAH